MGEKPWDFPGFLRLCEFLDNIMIENSQILLMVAWNASDSPGVLTLKSLARPSICMSSGKCSSVPVGCVSCMLVASTRSRHLTRQRAWWPTAPSEIVPYRRVLKHVSCSNRGISLSRSLYGWTVQTKRFWLQFRFGLANPSWPRPIRHCTAPATHRHKAKKSVSMWFNRWRYTAKVALII